MTGWEWNKHNCKGWKENEDNIVEYLADTMTWRLQWEGVGPDIQYCPYCGIELSPDGTTCSP
jgi:hypothetical protein